MVIRIVPCKGIHDSLGFWIPPCGFRIPSTGFRIPARWIPDPKKGWIPNFFCLKSLILYSELLLTKPKARSGPSCRVEFDVKNIKKNTKISWFILEMCA